MAQIIKPLTALQCDTLKYNPDNQTKNRLRDGGGLFLHITKTRKMWRIDYKRPFTNDRTSMTIGEYPYISLLEARETRTEFKMLLKRKIDPRDWLLEQQIEEFRSRETTFLRVAERWRDDFLNAILLAKRQWFKIG